MKIFPVVLLIATFGLFFLVRFEIDQPIKDKRQQHAIFLKSTVKNGKAIVDSEAPKPTRPDLAALQNFHQTVDPALQYVPSERLFNAYLNLKEESVAMNKTNHDWTATPTRMGGRMRGIMWDPTSTDGNKVWACSVTGGLWYNENISAANSSWNSVSDLWPNLVTNCITYDPNNPEVFYLGTGEYHTARVTYRESSGVGTGIWKSSDAGETWNLIEGTETFKYISDLAVKNENGTSVIYAGVVSGQYQGDQISEPSEGLFRSIDGGLNWQQVLPNVEGTSKPYAPADIEVNANGRIFIGSLKNEDGNGGATILYSDDGTMDSWTVYDNYKTLIENDGSNPIPGRIVLSAAPSDPNRIYAIVGAGYYNSAGFNLAVGRYIIKSNDQGESWTQTPMPNDNWASLSWHAFVVKVSPVDPDLVYIGGLDLYQTQNGGSSWNHISDWAQMYYGGGSDYAHADQHWIAYKPGTNNQIIFSTDGGIFYTTSGTSNFPVFQERSKGLNTLQFYAADLDRQSGQNHFIGGLQDNGSLLYTGSELWIDAMIMGGDGAYCFFGDENENTLITSVYYNRYAFYDDFDGVASFNEDGGVFINPADFDRKNSIFYSNKVSFTSSYPNRLLRYTNVPYSGFAETINLNTGLSTYFSQIRVSPYSPPNKTTLFVASTNGRLFKVTDAQATPSTVEIGSSSFPIAYISSIAVGGSEDTLLVTFSNYGVPSVWETYDGGTTWTDVSGDLPDIPVRWALYHPQGSNEVALSTDLGVWFTKNTAEGNWERDAGLPAVRTDMLSIRSSDNTLLAATHGRGMQYTTWNYNETTDVNEKEKPMFSIYPNPSDGVFRVSYANRPTFSVILISLDGKEVYRNEQFANGEMMDVSHLKTGTYFALLESNGEKHTQKIMVLK